MNVCDHVIIMGYRKDSTEKVVQELLENNPDEKIVLCCSSEIENPIRNKLSAYIKGELASEDVLSRSNASVAQNIIIHGCDDNETFFTAYAFREINKTAHMVCYLNNENHAEKIRSLPAQDSSLNQVLNPFNAYLMALELQDRESSGVIQQLVSNLTGENLYRFNIPEDTTFLSTYKSVFFAMKLNYGATLIAVKDQEIILNPQLDMVITSGMSLFYASLNRIADLKVDAIDPAY